MNDVAAILHPLKRKKPYVKYIFLSMLLGLSVFLLAACGLRPIQEGRTPELGPSRAESGGTGSAAHSIEVSLNCVEVGEVVTITATLTNATTAPFTITTQPLIDITLTPHMWPNPQSPPVLQWSATDQYPAKIDSVWMAGESRTYQWQWAADPNFVQQMKPVSAIRAAFETGEIRMIDGITPAGTIDTIFSVGTIETSPFSMMSCAELRRMHQSSKP